MATVPRTGVLAVTSHGCWRVTSPTLTETDTRGAGDSFTAALAYGLRTSADLGVTLRLGGAAAANVMRHGLGSAERTRTDAMARSIVLTRLD